MSTSSTTENRPPITAVAITLFGVFLFATKAIIVKLGYREGMDAASMLLLRMGFALPFYLLILFWGNNRSLLARLTIKDHVKIISMGIVGYYLSSYLDFEGLQYISANLERLILFVYPTLVVLISAFYLKKTITNTQLVAIVITYLGMFITFFEQAVITPTASTFWGIALVFGSALTYAIYLVGSSELLKRLGVVFFTAYSMVVSALCVLVHTLFVHIPPLESISTKVYLYGFVMAVFSTLIPSFLISKSLQKIGASNMSVIGSIGPVFTIVLSYYLLQETLSVYQMVGGVVILAGVYWVSRKK